MPAAIQHKQTQVLQYSGHFGITITQRSIAYNSQFLNIDQAAALFRFTDRLARRHRYPCALLRHLHQINTSDRKAATELCPGSRLAYISCQAKIAPS